MGGKGSGRKTKLTELKEAGGILAEAAPVAAQYLVDVAKGLVHRPSWSKIEVCKYVVDQVLGKARVRAEITGAGGVPLTMQALVMLAQSPAEGEEGDPQIAGELRFISSAPKPPGDQEPGGNGGSESKSKEDEEPETPPETPA